MQVYIFNINTQSAILFSPKYTAKVYNNLKGNTVRKGFSKWSKSDFCAYGHWWEWDIHLGHCQKVIEEQPLKCYTDEVAFEICKLVLQNCNGCCIDYPSQTQHDCLLMKDVVVLWLCFTRCVRSDYCWRFYEQFARHKTFG